MHPVIEEDISNTVKELKPFEKKIKKKRFLVTGGAGFLGSWLCDVLVRMKGKVICLDDFSSGSVKNVEHLLESENFNLMKGDVCSFDLDEEVDYILHLASLASPPLYQKFPVKTLSTNIIGTKKVLEFAKEQDVKVILFTSTSEVYGDAQMIPTPENYWGYVNPFGPRSCYDEGKRAAEAYCYAFWIKYKLPIRIARIFNTYGPRLDVESTSQYGRVVVKFIWQALNGKPITVYGDGKQTRSFCYITDQIIALLRLLLIPNLNGEVVNTGNDEEISILELAKIILALTSSHSRITFEPLPPDDPKRRCPDLKKARELLDFSPKVNLEEGLKRTISWMKNQLR